MSNSNAATNSAKETKVTTPVLDMSKMSVEEMIALSESLQQAAAKQSLKEYEAAIEELNNKLVKIGKSKLDAINSMFALMSKDEKASYAQEFAAANGFRTPATLRKASARGVKGEKVYKDADSTNARPTPGCTYSYNGMQWTKSADGKGAAKKEFLAAIAAGKTWAELQAK